MSSLTVYEKPTCTTCRKVAGVLKEKGVDYNSVNYFIDPIPKAKLELLVKKMKISAQELFRKREDIYKELKLSAREVSDDEAIELMVKHPELLQRPIVEKGDQAILARPAERIAEIL